MPAQQSHLLRKEACPRCREEGHDHAGDNMGVYSDGHSWCYRCGYHIPAEETIETLKEKFQRGNSDGYKPANTRCDHLPIDISPILDSAATEWLSKYKLAPSEMKQFWWSESRQQLIYPVFDVEGNLLMWQARNFDPSQKKYYSTGNVQDTFHILGGERSSRPLILTEDIVSAIKVSRWFRAMPLFGGYCNKNNLIRLRDHVIGINSELGIWLDPNKYSDSIELRDRARELGIIAFTVMSTLDPKEHADSDIPTLVNKWMLSE